MPRELGPAATAGAIVLVGLIVGLAGDACHVASSTTRYESSGVPTVWRSAIWFPVLLSGGVLAGAWASEQMGLAVVRRRGRADVITGAGAVLGLYALTAVVHDEPDTVSVVLVASVAIAIWSWWDPSPRALLIACAAAVLGPLAEIAIVGIGAASYAADADGLGGVAPWLPALYFAAGAVTSGLWRAIARDGRPDERDEATVR